MEDLTEKDRFAFEVLSEIFLIDFDKNLSVDKYILKLSKKRKAEIEEELMTLKQEQKVLQDSWDKEKSINDDIKKKKSENSFGKAEFLCEPEKKSSGISRRAQMCCCVIPRGCARCARGRTPRISARAAGL